MIYQYCFVSSYYVLNIIRHIINAKTQKRIQTFIPVDSFRFCHTNSALFTLNTVICELRFSNKDQQFIMMKSVPDSNKDQWYLFIFSQKILYFQASLDYAYDILLFIRSPKMPPLYSRFCLQKMKRPSIPVINLCSQNTCSCLKSKFRGLKLSKINYHYFVMTYLQLFLWY